MSGEEKKRMAKKPPVEGEASTWRLDPIIERRLSSASFKSKDGESSDDTFKAPAASTSFSGTSNKAQQTDAAAGRTGSQSFVMYSNEKKAQALSYSNIPGLGPDTLGLQEHPPNKVQSFSSLDLPGGHVGHPHSRTATPADGKWMQNLDLTRLFGTIGAYTRDNIEAIDETISAINTPTQKIISRRGTPTTPHQEALLGDDDDDDDDSDISFHEALGGIDKKRGNLSPNPRPPNSQMGFFSQLGQLFRRKQKLYTPDIASLSGKRRNYQSDYMALVPLSDPRLNKRWPLWVFILVVTVVSFTVFSGVFFFVQRQVTVNQGEIVTTTSTIHLNPSKPWDPSRSSNYTLDLEINVPVHNQNYFTASVYGELGVYLFNYKGGNATLDDSVLPRSTKVFSLENINCQFDSTVTSTIIERCTILRPNKLQFVLQGSITTKVLFYGSQTTLINTYAIVDCKVTNFV